MLTFEGVVIDTKYAIADLRELTSGEKAIFAFFILFETPQNGRLLRDQSDRFGGCRQS
jgi:hypothetical protein